ncbi:spore germination protein, partial [Bacillus thuringiensis]|uniref:spore germination protein n=1 Tax=Bacillus thuringiensis TaxID=1428 RepID=UPI0020BF47D2
DIANEVMLENLRQRLEQINHDGLTMADKSLEEWLFKQQFHPVPFVRYTERLDIAAAHLLEGHIAILVDTSPSVILVPVTIFHVLQHAEEYLPTQTVGT